MVRRLSLIITIVLLLLSFGCFAYPLSPNFSAYTQSAKYEACACSQIFYNITVLNSGDFVAGFIVKQEGTLAEYSIVQPEGFVLESGKTQVVRVFVNIPCNIRGNYPLTTHILNDMNVEKVIKQNFVINKCAAAELRLDSVPAEACRCSEFKYDFIVHNPGVYSEDYFFGLPAGVTGSFSQASATIKGGESAKFTAIIVPPCEYTSRTLKIGVSSRYTAQKMELGLPLKVKSDCAAKEYTPKEFNYTMWLLIGFGALMLIVIIIVIILIAKRIKRRQPRLVQLSLANEPKGKIELKPLAIKPAERKKLSLPKLNLPWKKIIIIILILALIAGAAYLAYTYLPKLFIREQHIPIAPRPSMFAINNTGQPPVEEKAFSILDINFIDYWVYIIAGAAVLIAAIIIFSLALKCRVCAGVKWARRILFVLFVLYALGFGAYFIYYFWDVIWPPVKEFAMLYYVYALIGLGILVVLIIFTWIIGKKKSQKSIPKEVKWDEGEHICEFCGRAFKNEAGLKRHQSVKH